MNTRKLFLGPGTLVHRTVIVKRGVLFQGSLRFVLDHERASPEGARNTHGSAKIPQDTSRFGHYKTPHITAPHEHFPGWSGWSVLQLQVEEMRTTIVNSWRCIFRASH